VKNVDSTRRFQTSFVTPTLCGTKKGGKRRPFRFFIFFAARFFFSGAGF
jgi:hypothetical protein